jgi:hypothetical protein
MASLLRAATRACTASVGPLVNHAGPPHAATPLGSRCQSRSRNELSAFAWYRYGALGCFLLYLKPRAITTDTVFFAPPAVASFSFLPAPRAHNAPIYFYLHRLKARTFRFGGWEVLRIVLFIRGMWSHIVLLFVAARASRGTAAVASSGRRKRYEADDAQEGMHQHQWH